MDHCTGADPGRVQRGEEPITHRPADILEPETEKAIPAPSAGTVRTPVYKAGTMEKKNDVLVVLTAAYGTAGSSSHEGGACRGRPRLVRRPPRLKKGL